MLFQFWFPTYLHTIQHQLLNLPLQTATITPRKIEEHLIIRGLQFHFTSYIRAGLKSSKYDLSEHRYQIKLYEPLQA